MNVQSGNNKETYYGCGDDDDCPSAQCTPSTSTQACCCKDKDLCNGTSESCVSISAFIFLIVFAFYFTGFM
jgi:hypothetical protein